ncbi:MAG: cell wall hydrolase [Candidatus Daviesbacteria bacterium]|nr:cell wall hydrolase [Candidatus Daviesbacteria bacterium]
MPNQFPKKITDIITIPFSVDKFGLYSITITARCQSSKQDLKVEIDLLKFRELPPKDKPQYNNIPPSWNGTELKGLLKIIIFTLRLNKGAHKLIFIPTEEAIIDEYKIESISDPQDIQFNPEMQAEDGDRRPWLIFTLVDLPLKSITADISTKWHFLDGDDVKLIIDNTIKKNSNSIFHKNWVWSANVFNIFSKERQEITFTENLQDDVHYIEFWADKTPIIHKVKIELGEINLKRIPTIDDPEWTGDLNDDSDQIILARAIFGEARDKLYPDKARIAVGWSIRNRVEDSRWSNTYQGVIMEDKQYSAFEKTDNNRPFVENPFWKDSEIDKIAWYNCYNIAGKVINGEIKDPTNGGNHYYDSSITTPYWATKKTLVLIINREDNKATLIFHKL